MKDAKEDHSDDEKGFEDHYSTPVEYDSGSHNRGDEVFAPPKIENSPESKNHKIFIKREGIYSKQLSQAIKISSKNFSQEDAGADCKGSSSQKLSGMTLEDFINSDI